MIALLFALACQETAVTLQLDRDVIAQTITLYSTSIAEVSVKRNGFHYKFNEVTEVTRIVDGKVVKRNVRLRTSVDSKRFSSLVAHVWRHELRHGEQIERLARADANDGTDRDGDLIYNDQEVLNDTDIASDKTWPTFPISTASAKNDQEVDCELRARDVIGVSDNDWAMDVRGKEVRMGTQREE